MARLISLITLFLFLTFGMATAVTPELSADLPIEFDARTKTLLAAGNAVFSHEDVVVMADEIRYLQDQEKVIAQGNVRVTQSGLRLVSSSLEYNMLDKTFRSGPYRAGYPPFYISGDSFYGTLEDITFENVTLFYGEPSTASPRLNAGTLNLKDNNRINASQIRFGVGDQKLFPFPNVNSGVDVPPLEISVEAGFRRKLGGFIRSEWLYPIRENLAVGANTDLYSARGILIGPALHWMKEGPERFSDARLSSGWIYDGGSKGLDIRRQRIEPNRYFADLSWREERGEWEFVLRSSLLSDSEVHRDFRPGLFSENQEPDHFAEMTWQWDNLLLSAFTRVQANDGYGMVERLPEVRLDLLSTKLGETDFYHSGHLSVLNYREVFLDPVDAALPPMFELERGEINTRVDMRYGVQRPVQLSDWATFTPKAQLRWTHYTKSLDQGGTGDLEDRRTTRLMGELGFDLEGKAFAEWNYANPLWGINQLRHRIRPVVFYRWHPGGDNNRAEIADYDRETYQPILPDIDLHSMRAIDTLNDLHVVRFGVENILQTRHAKDSGSRDLLEFNIYQDLLLSARNEQTEWDAFYLQTRLRPAHWLRIDFEQKVQTEDLKSENFRVRTSILSAEKWQLDFYADYREGLIDQYAVRGFYRLNPRWALTAAARYDARLDKFTRQRYGVRQRIGNAWDVEYSFGFSSGSAREDDVSFSIRVDMLTF